MNWDELKQLWSIPEPWSVRPIAQGENNLTQIIETSSGNYVLRSYRNDRSLEHIRYETSVLTHLQKKVLPFQVPAPVPTVTGEFFAILTGTIVTLSPYLQGLPPKNDNLEQTYAAGQALAELTKALHNIQVDVTPTVAPFPHSGDFEGWAGTAINPSHIIQKLPLTKEEQKEILILIEETQALAPAIYQTLPQQIIHRDYDQSNVLMVENSVTGILDFEFCGRDLRILDLAYALSQWAEGQWNTGKEWSVIDAFSQGYLQRQKLSLVELETLPFIFRLRATTSLFFRFGRYVKGFQTTESILVHIQEHLYRETWLKMHQEKLLSHIRSWYS
jgi:homoserine kinase type II